LLLSKAISHITWKSVVKGDDPLDPFTQQAMEKKMMLEKFQNEVRELCDPPALSSPMPFL
jgi:hypothetical protein